ncbi:MAG: hypothetical protein NT917_19400, partial [Microcystis aeruginosa WS75]|nr:hypothetical protein [Microcystis aeruginosa WS75]
MRYKSGVLLRSAFGIALDQISDRSHFDCEAVPNFDDVNPLRSSKILGLKPRRSTTALPLNISTFTEYMLKCSPW